MNKQDLSKLVDKYLKGECLPDEELLLEKYLESFQNDVSNWEANDLGNKQEMEDKLYLQIINKIKMKKENRLKKVVFSPGLLKIAASFILIIVVAGGLYLSGIFEKKLPEIVMNEKDTLPGEKIVLTLADNSRITLNAESKLRYPKNFIGKMREVYLEGEAYFEIQHDTSKPFIVHSGKISTTVLGTKFNVSAYSEDKEVEIALVEGSVKVSRTENEIGKVENIMILKPDQQLIYDKKEEISKVEDFDLQEATGWKDNILKFSNQPLSKIFPQLERRFGIKFELSDQSYSNKKITANFQNESVWTISEVIKKLTGLQYKPIKENNETKKIIFYRK